MRETTAIPVRNRGEALDIAPAVDGLIAVTVRADGASRETLHARKLVLATGQEGMGRWWMPNFALALPSHRRAHAADAIDFCALGGKVVAVLGAGASALDNAAVALEHGAAEVHVFCRRPTPQLVQPYRWLTFAGCRARPTARRLVAGLICFRARHGWCCCSARPSVLGSCGSWGRRNRGD